MDFGILIFALVIAVFDWFVVAKQWKALDYFFKPAVMIVLIVWLLLTGGIREGMTWFILGAVFSLVGDIFLMLPQNFFLPGLVSFLLAHISYIVGINRTSPTFTAAGVFIIILVIIIAWQIYSRLAAGIDAKGHMGLKIPVLIYVIVISLMTVSAILTFFRPEWDTDSAALISGGAILFFVSDSLLAWERFVSPILHGSLIRRVAYHIAQAGILIGAATHFQS